MSSPISGSTITGSSLQSLPKASDQVDTNRKTVTEDPANSQDSTSKNTLSSVELLKQIKAITENGQYAVNFQTDNKTGKLVVKVINTSTQQVVLQIPPEQLIGVDQALTQYEGNFVNTKL